MSGGGPKSAALSVGDTATVLSELERGVYSANEKGSESGPTLSTNSVSEKEEDYFGGLTIP